MSTQLEAAVSHLRNCPCKNCGYNERVEALRILRETAEQHDISYAALFGIGRTPAPVHARHCAMDRLRNELGLTLDQIGLIFHRHTSTVIHGLRRVS